MNRTSVAVARPPSFPGAGRLALIAALYTYGVIGIGGAVRITGAGGATVVEFLHGVLATGFLLIAIALLAFALRRRALPGFGGRGGVLRPMLLAALFAAAMALLDAIAARLTLSPHVAATQFLIGLGLLAALLVAAVRAGSLGGGHAALGTADNARRAWRMALGTAAFAFIVIALGAITAWTPGSPQACQGFPLCNGELLPRADAPTQIHWAHRMLALLLFLHIIGAFFAARKRAASPATLRAALAALVIILLQVLIAGALIGMQLAAALQVLHLVVGTALWIALVCWAALARRALRTLEDASPPALAARVAV